MRILLLSLYYPPLNTIASSRMGAFAKYLQGQGHKVDVITRYYDPEQQKGGSMFLGSEEPAGFTSGYIREGNVLYTNFKSNSDKLVFSKRLPPVIRGLYNYYHIDVFHYGWLSYALAAYEKEFSGNTYDLIISSYGPPVMLLAAKIFSQRYGMPYVVDFRDSYINEQDHGMHLLLKKQIQKRIVGKAAGIVFSTTGMQDYFFNKTEGSLRKKQSCVVYNGIDPETDSDEKLVDNALVTQFEELKEKRKLVLLHTGTLYQGQNIVFFTDAIERFNKTHQDKIVLVFLGMATNDIVIPAGLPGLVYMPRTNRPTAIRLQQLADALVLPVWNGRYTGFSGKTLEYLASGNIVLCSPEPQKDMQDFFEKSKNVFVLNNYTMFENICAAILNGNVFRKPIADPAIFTRRYWVEQLSVFLNKLKRDPSVKNRLYEQ